MILGPYAQPFIFYVTYEWGQQARMFDPGKPFQPSVIRHSSILYQFVSWKENEVLGIRSLGSYEEHFIFYVTYKWAQYGRVFVPGKPIQPSERQPSSILCPFVSSKENKV